MLLCCWLGSPLLFRHVLCCLAAQTLWSHRNRGGQSYVSDLQSVHQLNMRRYMLASEVPPCLRPSPPSPPSPPRSPC